MPTKATILIVDKEKILVDLMVRALKSNDLGVVGANSTEQANRLVEMHLPNLVVIDPTISDASAFIDQLGRRNPPVKVLSLTEKAQGLDAVISQIRRSLDTELPFMEPEGATHVLVVDDETELRNVLAEFLRERGYRVTIGKNGREAVDHVQADTSINVALLDVSMPVMGGLEALAGIMAMERHPSVIMMTAVADREVARQALKSGAFDYILKPFDFAGIEASIVASLSLTEYQKRPWWKRLTRG